MKFKEIFWLCNQRAQKKKNKKIKNIKLTTFQLALSCPLIATATSATKKVNYKEKSSSRIKRRRNKATTKPRTMLHTHTHTKGFHWYVAAVSPRSIKFQYHRWQCLVDMIGVGGLIRLLRCHDGSPHLIHRPDRRQIERASSELSRLRCISWRAVCSDHAM